MRAAQRARPKDGDADQKKDATVKKNDEKDNAKVALVSATSEKVDEVKPDDIDKASQTPTDVLATLGDLGLKPLQEREVTAFSKAEAHTQAADRLVKISEALDKYHQDKGHYPARFTKSSGGLPTLSWRVELLPYLGYQKLHDKFDFQRPWNYEPNKTLMSYIPPEFMSPERNDTKTNFLLPAFRTFLFGSDRARRRNDIAKRDGVENTILLLEVNDELAVEWIKPQDYDPSDVKNVKKDLGALRGDGTFAVWANGWTVMLANTLTNRQIVDALTYDSGDGQLASSVHRDIPTSSDSDTPKTIAISELGDDTGSDGLDFDIRAVTHKPTPIAPEIVREPKPNASEISKAQNKLRKIFLARIAAAKEDDEKSKLADEMVVSARGMVADPAGAYVLQTVAMSLGSEAGKVKKVISAVDQRVGRFDVDSYDENMRALLKFAESTTKRDAGELDGTEYLRRAIPVIFAAIQDNDFVRGSTLARHCYRLRDQEPDEELMKSLNRLRVLLGSAKREFDKSSESLAKYRVDPSDVESGSAFGRFLCFIKGDWELGLPLIALGGNKELMELAKLDLRGAKTYQEQIQIGDAWWDLSVKIRNGVYRQALQDRAASWYQEAWEFIPESLDRLHVKNRLDEIKDKPRSSPLALIQEMADETGVDLNISLTALANTGQRRTRANNDDG